MTTVVLEPPLGRSLPWRVRDDGHKALTHGPLLLRTRGMGRWHRPRSGSTWHRDGEDLTAYSLWCGQSVSSHRKTSNGGAPGFITRSELPDDGVPLCGTCEGRAVGAGHAGIAVVVHSPAGLLFAPERLTPPKVCPGVEARLYEPVGDGYRVALCLACGNVEPLRGYSNAGGGWMMLQRHPPGAGLVPGCPFHAWRGLVRDGDSARCQCAGGA